MPDLTKLQSYSETPSFKNLNEYPGSFVISGTVTAGANLITHIFSLPVQPEISDIVFFGRGDQGFSTPDFTTSPRPSDTWFKQGAIFVRGDGTGYSNYPVPFVITAQLVGNQLTISALCVIQFTATLTLTPETVLYKVVDYIST